MGAVGGRGGGGKIHAVLSDVIEQPYFIDVEINASFLLKDCTTFFLFLNPNKKTGKYSKKNYLAALPNVFFFSKGNCRERERQRDRESE